MKKSLKAKMLFSILLLTSFATIANLSNKIYITKLYNLCTKEFRPDANTATIEKCYHQTVFNNYNGIFILFILTCIVLFIMNRSVLKPAKAASRHLDNMQSDLQQHKADLSKTITTKSQDEIGHLIKGINLSHQPPVQLVVCY